MSKLTKAPPRLASRPPVAARYGVDCAAGRAAGAAFVAELRQDPNKAGAGALARAVAALAAKSRGFQAGWHAHVGLALCGLAVAG